MGKLTYKGKDITKSPIYKTHSLNKFTYKSKDITFVIPPDVIYVFEGSNGAFLKDNVDATVSVNPDGHQLKYMLDNHKNIYSIDQVNGLNKYYKNGVLLFDDPNRTRYLSTWLCDDNGNIYTLGGDGGYDTTILKNNKQIASVRYQIDTAYVTTQGDFYWSSGQNIYKNNSVVLNNPNTTNLNSFCVTKNGDIYCLDTNGKVFKNNTLLYQLNDTQAYGIMSQQKIYVDKNGVVYCITSSKIWKNGTLVKEIPGESLACIAVDKDGNIYCTSQANMTNLYKNGVLEYKISRSVSQPTVWIRTGE